MMSVRIANGRYMPSVEAMRNANNAPLLIVVTAPGFTAPFQQFWLPPLMVSTLAFHQAAEPLGLRHVPDEPTRVMPPYAPPPGSAALVQMASSPCKIGTPL